MTDIGNIDLDNGGLDGDDTLLGQTSSIRGIAMDPSLIDPENPPKLDDDYLAWLERNRLKIEDLRARIDADPRSVNRVEILTLLEDSPRTVMHRFIRSLDDRTPNPNVEAPIGFRKGANMTIRQEIAYHGDPLKYDE